MLGVISAIADHQMGAGPFKPRKATFTVEKNGGGTTIMKLPHMFNPTDLKIGRKVSWKCQPTQSTEGGSAAPYFVFSGGGDTLSFSMVFDCSEEPGASLTKELEAVYDLTYPYVEFGSKTPKKDTRAQIVKFKWESFAFLGVVDSVDITISLFDPEGRVRRATVAIAMQGYAFSTSEIKEEDFRNLPRADKQAVYTTKDFTGDTESSAASSASATLAKFGI